MTKIRGFFGDEKFVFIFDNVNDRLGVSCNNANSFLIGGDDGDNHHELLILIIISELLIACGKAAPIMNGPGLNYFQ